MDEGGCQCGGAIRFSADPWRKNKDVNDLLQFLFFRLLEEKLTVRIVGRFEWTELRLHCSILKSFVCINLRWPHHRFDRSLHHPGSRLLPLPERLQLLPVLVQQRLRWRSPARVVLFAHQISHT